MKFHVVHLRECADKGLTLNQLLGWSGSLTHRQMTIMSLFSEEEYNRPSRTDHYIMSLNTTVARILAQRPEQIQPEHFRLTFSKVTREPIETEEEKARYLRHMEAVGIAMVGGMRGLTIVDKEGNVIKAAEKKVLTNPRVKSPKQIMNEAALAKSKDRGQEAKATSLLQRRNGVGRKR